MPGYMSSVYVFYRDMLDVHIDRVRDAVVDAEAGTYTSTRLLSDVVRSSRDCLTWWKKLPLPWDGILPVVRMSVAPGADAAWGIEDVPTATEGVALVQNAGQGAWPQNFGGAIEARVVAKRLVVRLSGLAALNLQAGAVLDGIVLLQNVHIANFRLEVG